MSKILILHKQRPETALENLNRLTGLDFQSWPDSLLETGKTNARSHASEDAEKPASAPQRISGQG